MTNARSRSSPLIGEMYEAGFQGTQKHGFSFPEMMQSNHIRKLMGPSTGCFVGHSTTDCCHVEARRRAIEVNNKPANELLPPKRQSVEPICPEVLPQGRFFRRHRRSHALRQRQLFRCNPLAGNQVRRISTSVHRLRHRERIVVVCACPISLTCHVRVLTVAPAIRRRPPVATSLRHGDNRGVVQPLPFAAVTSSACLPSQGETTEGSCSRPLRPRFGPALRTELRARLERRLAV